MTKPAATDSRVPASPCIGICLIDPATCQCRGCLRTVDEITGWYYANSAEKRAMLATLEDRRRAPSRGSAND